MSAESTIVKDKLTNDRAEMAESAMLQREALSLEKHSLSTLRLHMYCDTLMHK